MELILLGAVAYSLIKTKQKRELEENLYDFFIKTKDQKKVGLNDDLEVKSKWNTVLTDYIGSEYYTSVFEKELPASWMKIKKFIFKRLNKVYPNWSKQTDRDIKMGVVSKRFDLYESDRFRIRIKTRLYDPKKSPIKDVRDFLKPWHKIDQIQIYCYM